MSVPGDIGDSLGTEDKDGHENEHDVLDDIKIMMMRIRMKMMLMVIMLSLLE